MKLRYKLTSLTLAGITIVTMGACSKNVKMTNSETVNKNDISNTITTTMPTTFSIFDDIDEFNEDELITTSDITRKDKDNNDDLTSKFSSQKELEQHLHILYISSGKNYSEIFNEYHEGQKEDYYIYRDELYTAASYMLIVEKGYKLEDLANELDYLLALRQNPREIIDEDYEALKTLYVISENVNGGKESNLIFQIFEQLSLERHKVSCPDKDKHTDGIKFLNCEHLNTSELYNDITEERGMGLVLKN